MLLPHSFCCALSFFHAYQAFQVFSEYLQVLESYSELSAVQEMGRGVEVSNFSIMEIHFYSYLLQHGCHYEV